MSGDTINLAQMVAIQQAAWNEARHKVVEEEIPGDLTDDEIQTIENFLKPVKRATRVGEAKGVRDYLIWRMAIEFGMRRSEILAMRTIDCPSRSSPYFKIVRIEERGSDYSDPREPRAPRPKTLSRDVGFVMKNTRFPKLLSDYITAHRYAAVKRHGRKVRLWMLPHSFLLVSESGKPLSQDYMGKLARQIRMATGVDFHWHLARHAFFNRAYAAVADIKDRDEKQVRLGDLVQWGGWADSESINIYVSAARRKRAQSALMFWQEGGNSWAALD